MEKILTIGQIKELDRTSGVPFGKLMENAGNAVFEKIKKYYGKCKVVVLCGPGNNGGDGYIVAKRMLLEGWDVRVFLEEIPKCCESKIVYDEWNEMGGKSINFKYIENDEFAGVDLIVDALFGSGVSKKVSGEYKKIVELVNSVRIPVVSIDLPSGINGDTGKILGAAIKANRTISFTALKVAHIIVPSREYCGIVEIVDIGIPKNLVDELDVRIRQNSPELWKNEIPKVKIDDNKYTRGMVLINSGEMHGATLLAAEAAKKVGAGIVYIICDDGNYQALACHTISDVLKKANTIGEFEKILRDEKEKSVLLGSGNVKTEILKEKVFSTLKFASKIVLDADAISVFGGDKNGIEKLFEKTNSGCIFTPHLGEFEKIFEYDDDDKIGSVVAAAKRSKSIVMLKGYDTIIASPNGEVVISTHSSPYLSIAGSGDVLAGIIVGLLARGMDEFKAVCCAVWIHGDASLRLDRIFAVEELIGALEL